MASISSEAEVGNDIAAVITGFYTPTNPVQIGAPIPLFFITAGVAKLQITAPAIGFVSDVIPAGSGTGTVEILAGINQTTTFTLAALDDNEAPITVNGKVLTATLKVVVI